MYTVYEKRSKTKVGNGKIIICTGKIRNGKTMILAKLCEKNNFYLGKRIITNTRLNYLPKIEKATTWRLFLIKHGFIEGLEAVPVSNLRGFINKKELLTQDLRDATIFVSEVSTMFPALKDIPPEYITKFRQGGKDGANWLIDAQRLNDVNRSIRENAEIVLYAKKRAYAPFGKYITDGTISSWKRKLAIYFYSKLRKERITIYYNNRFLDNSAMEEAIAKGEYLESIERARQEGYKTKEGDSEGSEHVRAVYKPQVFDVLDPKVDGKRYDSNYRVLPADLFYSDDITDQERNEIIKMAERLNREDDQLRGGKKPIDIIKDIRKK